MTRNKTEPAMRAVLALLCLTIGSAVMSSPAVAIVETFFCGDSGSDFGEDCSLGELLALSTRPFNPSIRIDGVRFGAFDVQSTSFPATPEGLAEVRVIPLGGGTNSPGLRFARDDGNQLFQLGIFSAFDIRLIYFVEPFSSAETRIIPQASFHLETETAGQLVDLGGGNELYVGGVVRGSVTMGGFASETRTFVDPSVADPDAGSTQGTVVFPSPITASAAGGFGAVFDIELGAGAELADFARLTAVEQRITIDGAPPPPAPEVVSGDISNGAFDQGADALDGWDIAGPGTVAVTATSTGVNAAELETDGAATTLSQPFATPRGTFMVNFDHKFQTTVGTLEVLIDDSVVGTIPAPASLPLAFRHTDLVVNDPDLMGRADATLGFRLQPGSLANVLLASVYSFEHPLSEQIVADVSVGALVTNPGGGIFRSEDIVSDQAAILVGDSFLGIDADVLAETVPSASATLARGDSSATVTRLGSVQFRAKAEAHSDSSAVFAEESAAKSFALMDARVVYELEGDPETGDPIPVRQRLQLSGALEISGDPASQDGLRICNPGRVPSSPEPTAGITLTAILRVSTERYDQLAMDAAFSQVGLIQGTVSFSNDGTPTVDGDLFEPGDIVCSDILATGEAAPGRRCAVAVDRQFDDPVFVDITSDIQYTLRFRIDACAEHGLNGTVVADFGDTLVADLTTTANGVEIRVASGVGSPTPGPTSSSTPGEPTSTPTEPPCPGDCDGDGRVSIAELLRGVNIALGNISIDQCPAFDQNWNRQVAINELVSAVNAALRGCG